jgi:hypothetical protein
VPLIGGVCIERYLILRVSHYYYYHYCFNSFGVLVAILLFFSSFSSSPFLTLSHTTTVPFDARRTAHASTRRLATSKTAPDHLAWPSRPTTYGAKCNA